MSLGIKCTRRPGIDCAASVSRGRCNRGIGGGALEQMAQRDALHLPGWSSGCGDRCRCVSRRDRGRGSDGCLSRSVVMEALTLLQLWRERNWSNVSYSSRALEKRIEKCIEPLIKSQTAVCISVSYKRTASDYAINRRLNKSVKRRTRLNSARL